MLEEMGRGLPFCCMSNGMKLATTVSLRRVRNGLEEIEKRLFELLSSICGRGLFVYKL
jgi:hypothetical protein